MDQERDQIREVDDARRRVAEDVRSVAENANVVERAKETAQNKMDDMKSTMSARVQQAREKLMDARDQMQRMSPAENPIGMLIAGLAVGFLIGLALPVTRFESERLGPLTQDMKDKARQASGEVMRRGSEVIKETISAGKDAATDSIREQARDMGMTD
jgi:hypothetical protein